MTHQDNSKNSSSAEKAVSADAAAPTKTQPTPPNPPTPKPRWLIYLIRLIIGAIIATLLLLVVLFAMTNSEAGSKFLIEKIALETGTELKYSEGSIRRGVWVQDVKIAQGEDITVTVNRAYVQLGWRALFARQVHLVNPDIDKVRVTNTKPSTGEPFDYATISLPVTLELENAKVNEIIYDQAGSEPVVLHHIAFDHALWVDSKVELDNAMLSYGDDIDVSRATGEIDLTGNYPLSLSADVHVSALDGAYFDTLAVKAGGSLKRTVGTLTSKYNQHDVTGSFIAQGLDKNSPFSARLDFDEVLLPYADSQNILLQNGTIIADGVISNIELRINTDLFAKDIPDGHYHGRGIIRGSVMDIPYLQADTPSGTLVAAGSMNWSDGYELDATISADGYRIREVMPSDYRDYDAYLPQVLTGTLGVKYTLLDKDSNDTRFEFDLNQKDGERIQATLAQNQTINRAPWRIEATWANLIRHDVPQIGEIHSRSGQASVRLEEGRTYIDATADIIKLNAAPSGLYRVQANIEQNQRLYLTDFEYQGVMGELSGTGRVDFATAQRPLAWQLDLTANPVRPNAYFQTPDQTPFERISGRLIASGRLREVGDVSIHDIKVDDSDLIALLNDGKQVHLTGQGTSELRLQGGEIRHLKASFDGQLNQDILPQLARSSIGLDVEGSLNDLTITRALMINDSGKVSLAGRLGLDDGIAWDIKGRLDEVDTAAFVDDENLIAIITGDLATSGRYRDGALGDVALTFDGQVLNNSIPNGNLSIDATGSGSRFMVNHLRHDGEAGALNAKGWVDISQGAAWQLEADMSSLNLGAFIQSLETDLNGTIQLAGSWQEARQIIDIGNLDITGSYNNQPLIASGSLYAELALPKDLAGYIESIKQASRPPTSSDELLALRNRIDDNARQTQNIIRKLDADNLQVRIGNNHLTMSGDERQLTTSVNVVDLGQLINTASGAIQGGVIVMNDHHALPTLYIDASVSALRLANITIQNAQAIGKIVNLGNSESQLLVQGDDIIVMGRVIKSARIDFSGTEANHILSISTKSGDIEASTRIDGAFNRSNMRYSGVLSDGFVNSRFGEMSQRQPTEFAYGLGDGSLQVAAHCWQSTHIQDDGVGVICLQDTLSYTPESGNVNLIIQNLDTQVLSAALPSDIRWQSMLNGRIKAQWQPGRAPLVDAVLYSDDGTIGLTQEDTGYVEMPYQRASVIAKSVEKGLKVRTDVLGAAGRGYADVIIDPNQADKPISGALVMNDLNLAVLRPFFPSIQVLSGKASLAGGLGGTLSRPLFYGNANLEDGALSIVGVPLPISDVDATMSIRGTYASLDGSFVGGEGHGVLYGEMDWAEELHARLGVFGENLTVSQPPLVTAQISPELEVMIRPFQKFVEVKGVVSIPSATIRPPEATADIVTESPDVSVLDRRITGNVDQILARAEPWDINANIGIDLGNNIEFRGFGAVVPLAGALHLTQSGQGAMQALGVIQVSERTKIDVIGQNLDLNYAQIRFDGDMLNPRLSIEGEKQIEGQTVGVRIRGTASDPDITVFNDAGLGEHQAMNALITGRIDESSDLGITEQGFRSQVTNHLAAAGLSLGLSGTRDLTNQIGQAFGFQSLTIDASGSSDDTNVNVTGYITPDLYLRYGVGVFNAESTLSMRYQLTRRVYIEATSAAENMVDVIYRWKF
ncbi:translocation/assembly module TamB domain-containing protein [Moraxella canis]|uniref:Translocation/assembly module TamB domain-containing protein n=1 Tax=Moraxella canis TaxID=90239 RepID=A0ABZ0WYP4_9GAMM|nr:translocation/assembly module TamB domain-containing protein [Moraxella canis]WQE04316.1 translocation/assembly module TamB domain-containing protein [Moraxella canis]